MPLGQNLPAKIKNDIWDGKFVDLAKMLYPDSHTTFGVQMNSETGLGELKLTQHKKKISSISEWQKAFNTYISVYIQKPGREAEAADLLTYMSEVQSIAESNLDWYTYDDLFRRDRAANPNPPPWSSLNQSIHNLILRKRSSGPDQTGSASTSYKHSSEGYQSDRSSNRAYRSDKFSTEIPYGYCFLHHTYGKTCTKRSCDYKHLCYKCNSPKPHPQFNCGRQNSAQNNNNNHSDPSKKSDKNFNKSKKYKNGRS